MRRAKSVLPARILRTITSLAEKPVFS